MKLDDKIAAINEAIAAGLPASLKTKLDGVALAYKVQALDDRTKTRTENLLALGTAPASPDDNYDVHIFHLVTGGEYTPSEIPRGRVKEQTQRSAVVLIAYTDQPALVDYLGHTLAGFHGVELKRLELSPDLINEKYLFLEKQPNGSGPRQLIALTYLLDCQHPLGGGRCPVFEWI